MLLSRVFRACEERPRLFGRGGRHGFLILMDDTEAVPAGTTLLSGRLGGAEDEPPDTGGMPAKARVSNTNQSSGTVGSSNATPGAVHVRSGGKSLIHCYFALQICHPECRTIPRHA